MEDKIARKVLRQLRVIKFLLGFFALLLIAFMAAFAFVVWQAYSYVQTVNTKINNFETSITNVTDSTKQLDLKKQACQDKTMRQLLGSQCDAAN